MKNKKARKRLPFPIPIWLQVAFALWYALASFVYNYLKYGFTDFFGSLLVTACLVGLFYLFAYHIRCIFDPIRRTKALRYAILLYVLIPLLCWGAVYYLLPRFGILLYDPNVSFRAGEFAANVFLVVYRMTTALALYTLYYAIRQAVRSKEEVLRSELLAQQEKEQIRGNLLLSVMQSHHLKNALQDIVNRAEELYDKYIPALLPRLMDVWDYSIQTLQTTNFVIPIQRELQIVDDMVATIRLKHEDDGVVEVSSVGKPKKQYITPLALVTPLENAATHGYVDAEHPIRIALVFEEQFFKFTCTNYQYRRPQLRQPSGKGLLLLQQSLSMMPYSQADLEYHQHEDTFNLCLTIKYNT